jgi:hypothetical protein
MEKIPVSDGSGTGYTKTRGGAGNKKQERE